MEREMEFATVSINLRSFTDEGHRVKLIDIPGFAGSRGIQGKVLCFELKQSINQKISSFEFQNELYMVDKQEDNYFEAICIEVKKQ
jgi:hypothetical protein